MIVATQVTANGSDQGQMLPVLEQAKTNVGENPETVLADAGMPTSATYRRLRAPELTAMWRWVGRANSSWRRFGANRPGSGCDRS